MQTVTAQPQCTIATFDDYRAAERAIDHLSDRGFPVEHVKIVGHDLRYVEQVAGRMTTGRAALLGAIQGSVIGASFGLLAALIFSLDPNPAAPLLVLYGLVMGAIIGALLGAAVHAATGGERDFATTAGLTAARFDVVVDQPVADRAAEILHEFEPSTPERSPT